MSSNGFATALHLEPRPSRWLGRLLIPFHGLVAGALLFTLPAGPALTGAGLLALLSWRQCRHSRLPRRIMRDADGGWWLDAAGPFALQPATFVSPWLVVLNLGGTTGVHRLALLYDQLPARQWRHLRVMLRVSSRPG